MVGRPTVMTPLVKLDRKLIMHSWKIVRKMRRFELACEDVRPSRCPGSEALEVTDVLRTSFDGGNTAAAGPAGWSSHSSVEEMVAMQITIAGQCQGCRQIWIEHVSS